MPAHHGQFLLSASPGRVPAGWRTQAIGSGILQACPALPIWEGASADGKPVVLIGLAVHLAQEGLTPAGQITRSAAAEIPGHAREWGGRWVLIVDGRLHLDASGNLGVVHTARGEGLVSSSTALVAELAGIAHGRQEIVHGLGIDWYPGTRVDAIRRLVPGQTIDLATLQVGAPPAVPGSRVPSLSVAAAAERLADALAAGLRNLAANRERLYLPLTGGLDSRTLLAACVHAQVPAVTYTFDKPLLAHADRYLPPRLASIAKLEHRFIARGRFSRARSGAFARHTFGQCVDADRKYHAYGQWEGWAQDGIILRGGCFEFGRAFYDDDLAATAPHSADEVHDRLGPRWLAGAQPAVRAGLERWVAWQREHPLPGLDWRDRFYLEQRLGCWLADIEQALDLTGTRRVHLANAATVFEALNAVDRPSRQRGEVQKAAIARLAPELLTLPFNPADRRVVRAARGILGAAERAMQFLGNRVAFRRR